MTCAVVLGSWRFEMVKAPGSSVPELPQGHSKTAKRHLSVCLTRSNAAFAFFDSELCEVCGGCGYNFKVRWRLLRDVVLCDSARGQSHQTENLILALIL